MNNDYERYNFWNLELPKIDKKDEKENQKQEEIQDVVECKEVVQP